MGKAEEPVFYTFQVQVAMGMLVVDGTYVHRHDEAGQNLYVPLAEADTFGIARYLAYAIAARGIPTAWPKRENKQHLGKQVGGGWYTASPEKARGLGAELSTKVSEEVSYDQAILATRDMRTRARLGNLLTELRALGEGTSNPAVSLLVRESVQGLSIAALQPVVPDRLYGYGVSWVPGAQDVLDQAAESWGVERFPYVPCSRCGVVHGGGHGAVELGALDEAAILEAIRAFGGGDGIPEMEPQA